ncbi:hypothetical protein DVR12_17790 [Chitinophaga silvatica]|uniref:Uncharacterized protein n=1 Tax=Chitinophaga silvatica TaxID=2282649 RepID=A0A3E1Y819_9BACT|nr:hypothetical protein [Chitinophaga silvatica]RFS21186.1 hypothetical protein DVR12_17790 [Chitinophaga silvatica]
MKLLAIFTLTLLIFSNGDPKLISKQGVGRIDFKTRLDKVTKAGYLKTKRQDFADEAGEFSLGLILYNSIDRFVSLQADPATKEVYEILTNDPDYHTQDNIKVGMGFLELISKRNDLELVDGEGGEIVAYLRNDNLKIYFDNLKFKNEFDYENKHILTKEKIQKNLVTKRSVVTFISVVKYALPR